MMPSLPTDVRILEGEEEAKTIAYVRNLIAQKPKVRDVSHWERGWKENLDAYLATRDPDALMPKYIRPGLPLRCNGRFVMPDDPFCEWKWYRKLLEYISDRWLADSYSVLEIGSGSGHNLAWLKLRYPEKSISGWDWSPSAVAIARVVSDGGSIFNMFKPPPDAFPILQTTTVLTVGAMEQTGTEWQPLLNFLLATKPKRVVHVEPILDWYNPNNPVDQTAIEAHLARDFWTGYLDALINLMDEGKIAIKDTQYTSFGSLLVCGYSILVWRPL